MGAYVNFGSHVQIAEESWVSGVLRYVGWRDIDDEMFRQVADNPRIHTVQIQSPLCDEAYALIDRLLEARPDLWFRVFSIMEPFDIPFLTDMPHLTRLRVEGWLVNCPDAIDPHVLCQLPRLKALHLNLFDLHDYSFLQNLSPDLEDLSIMADTMKGGIAFDCEWLLRYANLHSLFLGQKAKKHLERIAALPRLHELALRGIKVADFGFLRDMPIESFRLLYCGNNDLSALGELTQLKELELWRILKLTDIDFISRLVNLEKLSLQDLKHITALPNLDPLTKLHDIRINNVPIDRDALDERIRSMVHY